jgi:hypothetical protein
MFCLLGKVNIIQLHCHVISEQIWLERFLKDLKFFSDFVIFSVYEENMGWEGD